MTFAVWRPWALELLALLVVLAPLAGHQTVMRIGHGSNPRARRAQRIRSRVWLP